MPVTTERVGRGAPVLVCSLIAAVLIVATPVRYPAWLSFALSAAQLLVMAAAASFLIPAWRSGEDGRRQLALIGVLLLMPWALLTLIPGYGPPFASTLAMNHLRFVILFVSIAFLGAALFLLQQPLARTAAIFCARRWDRRAGFSPRRSSSSGLRS